jgi:thiamine-monophosphate kinase
MGRAIINPAMKVSEIGEFGLIDLLAKMVESSQDEKFASWQQLIIGIGDDAAAWRGDASIQLATVDSLIQDVHFSLDIVSWEDLGWRSIAANLSDIAAMGGMPKYALVSLALPEHTEVNDVTALYQGMIGLAQQFEVAIVGGNISRAPLVAITITIIGNAGGRNSQILTRSTAVPSKQIAVTGYLGTAAAGLEMLTKRLQFNPAAMSCLKKAFLRPYPRVVEGQLLAKHGVKTAIDISDGLISDLSRICEASGVGARIEVDRVPIEPIVRANFGDKALELALSGGEDYELLFTGSPDVVNKVREVSSCPITVVGEVVADRERKVALVDSKSKPFHLNKTGWNHFAIRSS